jgi:hypothetical protein
MELENVRIIFITIGLIGVLLFASPTIGLLIRIPAGQKFSELYLLGPDHTFGSLPFNIVANVTYLTYLGVGNNMGSSCYYTCFVKMGNETQLLPNATLGTASPLSALYEYDLFVSDGGTWEAPFTFQVNDLAFANGVCQLSGLTINGVDYPVNIVSAWDSNQTGFYYNLFVELSLYNATSGLTQYNNRYVDLILNMTQ